MKTRAVRVKALAKINLTLRILGQRPDGYHDLITTFQSLALFDTLTLHATPGPFRLVANDSGIPADDTNLVSRAAQLMWRAAGRRGKVRDLEAILIKRIPTQAGLGGGSSDAAATLRGLARLWKVKIPSGRLHEMAATLGADVPFFLHGGTARGTGRGDVIVPLPDIRSAWVVIARPDFGVATRDAYQWLDEDRRAGRGPVETADSEARNDFEPPVIRRHPKVARIIRALSRLGASQAAMSGSGSAVFGLFPSKGPAQAAAKAVAELRCDTLVTRTASRQRYRTASAPVPCLPPTRSIV